MDWHRLFGLTLIDFFTDSPFVVELEKDLSLKQQLLDVVVLRKRSGEFVGPLPDGLENLAEHNLLSYKSLWEALDAWALDELIGHYVNYRKQVSPSVQDLLPPEHFRLYGISTRFPEKLDEQVQLENVQTGVYEVVWGIHRIRVLVLSQMPEEEQNALWNLFSGVREKVVSGAARYRRRTGDTSTIMNQLFERYQLEGIAMPYTMEDFRRDFTREHLDLLTAEEVLQRFSAEEVLQRFSAEERLRSLSAEERLRSLSAEERLRSLSAEEIRAYLKKLEKQQQKRRKQ